MKKSVVIKTKKIKALSKAEIDYKSVLFFVLFICGLIIGVTIIKNVDETTKNAIFVLLKRNLFGLKESSFIQLLSVTFLNLFLLWFYVFLFGFCALGTPFIWLNPLFWGLLSGGVVSSYYVMFGFAGLGYFSVINLPCYAITAATLIRGCCVGSNMSNEIFLSLLRGEWKKQPENTIKVYTIKFIALLIPLALSALIKSGSFVLFGDLFGLV